MREREKIARMSIYFYVSQQRNKFVSKVNFAQITHVHVIRVTNFGLGMIPQSR